MKTYNDENKGTIIDFSDEKKGKLFSPYTKFPFWSVYTPVLPCVYDGTLTILELINKLYHYINKVNSAVNQNHDDIIALSEIITQIEIEINTIYNTIGELDTIKYVDYDFSGLPPATSSASFVEIEGYIASGELPIARFVYQGNASMAFPMIRNENEILFIGKINDGSDAFIIKHDVDNNITTSYVEYITKAGGTINGDLIITAPHHITAAELPTENAHLANKEYVDEEIENANNIYYVTYDVESNPITCDKSVAEIMDAYNAGKYVIAKCVLTGQNIAAPLFVESGNRPRFVGFYEAGANTITIKHELDNSISINIRSYLTTNGGIVQTGRFITLNSRPVEPNHAANKAYVDGVNVKVIDSATTQYPASSITIPYSFSELSVLISNNPKIMIRGALSTPDEFEYIPLVQSTPTLITFENFNVKYTLNISGVGTLTYK